MSKQRFNSEQVNAILIKMRAESMSQGMTGDTSFPSKGTLHIMDMSGNEKNRQENRENMPEGGFEDGKMNWRGQQPENGEMPGQMIEAGARGSLEQKETGSFSRPVEQCILAGASLAVMLAAAVFVKFCRKRKFRA